MDFPLSTTYYGKHEIKIEEEEKKYSPLINLGLEIGGPTNCYSNNSSSFDHQNNSCVRRTQKLGIYDQKNQMVEKMSNTDLTVVYFTEDQLQEFKTQILIFKYIVFGLPVPIHFLLPSFSSSFASHISNTNNPFVLEFVNLYCDNRHMMDLEPGRCRRTDGKKWRCHKSVVPNQKYCENHMHRGRKRSRKLVETSTEATSLNSQTLIPANSIKKENDFEYKLSAQIDPKRHTATSKNPMSCGSSFRGNIKAKDASSRVMITAPSLSNNAVRIYDDDKQSIAGKFNSNVKVGIAASKPSSGLDFSPKSVLQGALRHLSVEKSENDPNSEPGRCRRTDGKRWRCSSQVLPHQKYCATHMNRGAKKPITPMSTCGTTKHAFSSSPDPQSNGPQRNKLGLGLGLGLGLDTNLNFPLSASSADPRQNIEDDNAEASGGSGSTTETTVTDGSTEVLEMITLSS